VQEVDHDYERSDIPHPFQVEQIFTDDRVCMDSSEPFREVFAIAQVRFRKSATLNQFIQYLSGIIAKLGAIFLTVSGCRRYEKNRPANDSPPFS
jgi:hypothetical protein